MRFAVVVCVLLLIVVSAESFHFQFHRPRFIFRPQILVAMPNEFRVRRSLKEESRNLQQVDYQDHPYPQYPQDQYDSLPHHEEVPHKENFHLKIKRFFWKAGNKMSNWVEVLPAGTARPEVIDLWDIFSKKPRTERAAM